MPLPAHDVARRDDRLAYLRRLSLWIAGGAAAATLALGTAFAHALPGHARPAGPVRPAAGQGATGQGAAGQGAAGQGADHGQVHRRRPDAPPGARRHGEHRLRRPQARPASTPAAPVVVSGGS